MDKITINWHDLEEDEDEKKLAQFSGFYAIVAFNAEDEEDDEVDLLYIGMAYQESILDKVEEPHIAFNFLEEFLEESPEMEVFFMMGVIEESSLDIMSRQFYADVQCLLVEHNDPIFNPPCDEEKDEAKERKLHITNTGDFEPLEEITELA